MPVRSCTGFSLEPGFDRASIIAASESGLRTVLITLAATKAQTTVATHAAPASQTLWMLSASPRMPVVRATSRSAAMRLSTMPPATRSRSTISSSRRSPATRRTARLSALWSSAIRTQGRARLEVSVDGNPVVDGELVVQVGGQPSPGPSASHLGQSSFIESRSAARPRASLDLTVPTVTSSENAISR